MPSSGQKIQIRELVNPLMPREGAKKSAILFLTDFYLASFVKEMINFFAHNCEL